MGDVMSNEMIERVKQTIQEKIRSHGQIGHIHAAPLSDGMADACARAAIAAMREPTSTMLEASNREWDGRMSHRSTEAWHAMIDEALKP